MPKGKNSVQIGVIMPNELKDLLQSYADAHHWSMSQAACLLIKAGLEDWNKTTDIPPKTLKQ
jgi:hypothetical protein